MAAISFKMTPMSLTTAGAHASEPMHQSPCIRAHASEPTYIRPAGRPADSQLTRALGAERSLSYRATFRNVGSIHNFGLCMSVNGRIWESYNAREALSCDKCAEFLLVERSLENGGIELARVYRSFR